MLQQQSTDEFVQRLSSSSQAVVVSLSPQSRASLATHYGITPLQVPRAPSLTDFCIRAYASGRRVAVLLARSFRTRDKVSISCPS
jgi:hypothetical protein